MHVLAYLRVSTAEQADSRAGLRAQSTAIERECAHRGWVVRETLEDAGCSARSLNRPAIQDALTRLASGQADALVVAKLDRLSRSMLDFTSIMARAQQENWAVVALDCAVDTTTPAGEAMANVLATFAQFERRLIGQRTKEALEEKRRQGVRLGRPVTVPADVEDRIVRERATGASLRAIAAGLNRDLVPTAHGGVEWRPSSLEGVLKRVPHQREVSVSGLP